MAAERDPFHHVRDLQYFKFPDFLGGKVRLPPIELFGYEFQLTKFMVLQVVAGLLTLLVFWGLSRRIRNGELPPGRWWNFWETLAVYIRDEVVRPTIGHDHEGDHAGHEHESYVDPASLVRADMPEVDAEHYKPGELKPGRAAAVATGGHPADRYLPFIWTAFFYILFSNLLGLIPWMGSPTGNLNVTGALALTAFGVVIYEGSKALGPVGFWKAQVPEMGVSGVLSYLLVPMVWGIEVMGLFIKHSVLAVRLFANMMAGHTVLGALLMFIAMASTAGVWVFGATVVGSVFGQAFILVLEVLFAFIQAYIFIFLATVFISGAIHPH